MSFLYYVNYTLIKLFWGASLAAQWSRICLPVQETPETQIRSLDQVDPLEKEMATHSNVLAWEIPRTEEPDGLQTTGS